MPWRWMMIIAQKHTYMYKNVLKRKNKQNENENETQVTHSRNSNNNYYNNIPIPRQRIQFKRM